MDGFYWDLLAEGWVAFINRATLSLGAVYCTDGQYSFKIGDSLERSMISPTPLEGITTLDEAQAAAKMLILLSLKQTGSEE